MHHSRVAAVLVAVSLSLVAQAGVIRHDRDDSLYRALADEPRYASAVAVEQDDAPHCSGTLVGPSWVLTAAHCTGIGDLSTVPADGSRTSVSDVFVHPDYDPNSIVNGFDLALLKLESPVTSVSPAQRYRGNDEIGHVGTSVGYGWSGDGFSGLVTPPGTRRAGTNVIDSDDVVFGIPNTLLTDFDNPLDASFSNLGDPTPLDLEYLPASGDSGGPVFIDVDGRTLLAGVHKAVAFLGLVPDTYFVYGDILLLERVSPVNAWIDSVIPEPATLALLALGMLAAARRRRV